MADNNQNIVQFRLTGTLSISGTTVNVSNDVLRDIPISCTDASITFENEGGTSFELVKASITAGVLTTSKRGITQAQTLTEDATLKREWRAGTIGFITSFASDAPDNEFLKPERIKLPVVADTTARDALYPVPLGGEMVEVTSLGSATQKYNAVTAQWETFDIGTPTPNASLTAAGKVEIGTQAEVNAGTDTGGSGAPTVVIPSTLIAHLNAYIATQANLVNAGLTGEVKMWTAASPPTNWLTCDGSSLLRAGTYAALFAVLGTTYGAADGTHFNIPDFRGRSPIGSGTGTAAGATAHALGATPITGAGGEETHVLTTNEMPAHTHPLITSTGSNSGTTVSTNNTSFPAGSNIATSSTGGGAAHNILGPNTAVNFIIRI